MLLFLHNYFYLPVTRRVGNWWPTRVAATGFRTGGQYCVEAWVCRAVMESESVLYFSFAIRNRSVYNASRPIGLPKPKPESAVAILYLFVVCLQGTPHSQLACCPIFSCVRSQHIVSLMFHTTILRVVREVDSDS